MICSRCSKEKNIVYYDYCKDFRLRLCYSCLQELGWKEDLKQILPKLHICPECSSRYLSNRQNPKECGLCWKKIFLRPIDLIKETRPYNPQKKVKGGGLDEETC